MAVSDAVPSAGGMTGRAGPSPQRRTGGQVLIDQLLVHGVDTVFSVPGESYLAAVDAMYDVQDALRLYVCRQEGGAANMAEAYGKLTGEPGICFVTRGPGAMNASIAVHTAQQDSTPMILFVGQVSSHETGREAFQELDYRRVFGGLAKWATQVEDADRLPEIIHRAFTTATSGRPGPVVVALPENVLRTEVVVPDARRYAPVRSGPTPPAMTALRELLLQSERPLVLVGGSGWTQRTASEVQQFAELWDLPVVTSFRRQDLVDDRSPVAAGSLGPGAGTGLGDRVRQADLLVVVGARLGEMTTSGYSLVNPLIPVQRLVHVHAGVEELGRVYQADLAINSGMAEFAAGLAQVGAPKEEVAPWAGWRAAARAAHVERTTVRPNGQRLDLAWVVGHISATVPGDTVITNGAGNYSSWVHRYYQFTEHPSQLGPTSGAMGYALPAALAAKVVHPDRVCIAFHGDGCFQMTAQELATATQYGLDVIVIVVNNGMYGTIRMHQEMRYPERVIGTGMVNPDFVALAAAYGAHAERVETTEDFPAAFERALRAGRPALLELVTDPDQVTPDSRLSVLRQSALAQRS